MIDRVEHAISSAAKAGWNWFDEVDPELKKNLDARQVLAGEDGKAIAKAWAEFAATPQGEKALRALYDATLGRTVFFVNLGLDPAAVAQFGAFREGQNALAHEIFRQIAMGRNEPGPKPRDT